MFATFACYQTLQIFEVYDRNWLWKTSLWLSLVGVSVGFAGASKLSGLSSLVAGLLVGTLIAIKLKRSLTHKVVFLDYATLIITLFTCVAFVGLNPYLWPDPVGRTLKMFQNRVREMYAQHELYPQARIDTVSERIKIVPRRVFQDFAAISIDGFFYANIVFFVVGIYRVLSRSRQWLVNKVSESSPIAILIAGFVAAGPSLFTPLDGNRYYLLPVFFSTLLIAIGIDCYIKKNYQVSMVVYKRLV